jgi:hypothetical protein
MNTPPGNKPIPPYVLLNKGSGEFVRSDSLLPTDPGTALDPGVRRGTSVLSADLDGDGRDDVVIGAAFSTATRPISSLVLWNEGSGFRGPQTALPFPTISGATHLVYDIQAADLNGDGRSDLLVAYQQDVVLGGWELQILINDGQRGFTDQTNSYLPTPLQGLPVMSTGLHASHHFIA